MNTGRRPRNERFRGKIPASVYSSRIVRFFSRATVSSGERSSTDRARSIAREGTDGVYLSFDVDSLDAAHAPGTCCPTPGGLTTREAQALLRGLRGLNLIGGDVVEVAPPYDPAGNTALAAATMMFEILCLLAEARDKRFRIRNSECGIRN